MALCPIPVSICINWKISIPNRETGCKLHATTAVDSESGCCIVARVAPSVARAPKSNLEYLRLSGWRRNFWQTMLVIGVVLGAYIANQYLSETPVAFLPEHYSGLNGAVRLLIGGVLVGVMVGTG